MFLVKACMQRLSSSGIVHHGGRSVDECGPVAREIGGVVGLLMYITQNGGFFIQLLYHDREFLMFGDIFERGDQFCRL